MQESADVPDPVTLFGVRAQVNPVAGLMPEDRLTTPLKPCSAVIVTVEVPADPAFEVTAVGLVAIAKS